MFITYYAATETPSERTNKQTNKKPIDSLSAEIGTLFSHETG